MDSAPLQPPFSSETTLEAAAFFRALPKIELHCHLFGTVRKATFEALARRAGAPVSAQEIDSFYTRGPKPVGVLHVLRTLDQHIMRDADAFYRITRDYLEDAARDHVRYAEFFWNPTGTMAVSGVTYPLALSAIVRAIHDAEKEFSIVGRLIPSIDRQAEPSAANEMVEIVGRHRCDEVIGIGMDYREVDRPPELFAEAYALAGKLGLKRTAHAGEFGMPWVNVRTVIEVLHVDRIDHGYTVIDEPEYAARCAERGIIFTVVPTNSYYLRTLAPERWAQDHPIRAMPKLGLRIHPNTDDPTLHQVTPGKAWHMMCSEFGFKLDEIFSFMINGIDAAWVDESMKARWRLEWRAEGETLRKRLASPLP